MSPALPPPHPPHSLPKCYPRQRYGLPDPKVFVGQELRPLGVISQVEGVHIGQDDDGHADEVGGILPDLIASLVARPGHLPNASGVEAGPGQQPGAVLDKGSHALDSEKFYTQCRIISIT